MCQQNNYYAQNFDSIQGQLGTNCEFLKNILLQMC